MASLKAMRSITDLGQNIKQARLSRRFSILGLATRANISERTLIRLEKGDPGVGIGNLASVLAALGEPAALGEVMSLDNDPVGLSRAERGCVLMAQGSQPLAMRGRSGPGPRKTEVHLGDTLLHVGKLRFMAASFRAVCSPQP